MQTFMKPDGDKYTMRRAEYTKMFMLRYLYGKAETVLDVGENNPVGNYLASSLELELENTVGDLDYNFSPSSTKHDVVFCFEVLEHLMSPKYFLLELKKYMHRRTQLFISYPCRPKLLWTDQHFHEYDRKRFQYLLDSTGFRILATENQHFPRPLWAYLNGIRPMLRIFINTDRLIYAKRSNP